MSVVAIIQARMASTRLPGKVLADVAGAPMLVRVVERVARASRVDRVVVATSRSAADDPVADLCASRGVACFRGDEQDVLDRFYRAAAEHAASVVVRITADCPLIDPEIIDRVVDTHLRERADYTSNVDRRTYPDGLDVETMSFAALERAWRDARLPSEREHVTPFLRTSPLFTRASVESDVDLSHRRWTVDSALDLQFVCAVYTLLADRPRFVLSDVIDVLRHKPETLAMESKAVTNAGYYKSLYAQAEAGAAPRLSHPKSEALFARAKNVIPSCAQTFSKGHTQHVRGVAPLFLERGKGCRVWDVDGHEYIDYIQGLLPNILGYAHDEVNAAATEQLRAGHSFSMPHPLEVELAERLKRIIPCGEMTRFGKNGSDATAGAVRAARAKTGRDRIACSGYHGWQDWFIGTTTRSAGVPQAVRDLTHAFPYNDLEALGRLLAAHPNEFAAVILEPVNFVEPKPGFLEGVRDLAHRHGALLVFDEICSGFHFGLGGAQKKYGVVPDMACFGKAMGNGFPIACVVGRADVMRVFDDIFFSFTFGGEVMSMAAALKVLDILERTDALARMHAHGTRLQQGFNTLVREAGLTGRLECIGHPAWSLIRFRDANGADSLLERSLFQQEAVKRGLLVLVSHNMCAAHDEASIDRTLHAYAAVMKTLSGWLAEPDPTRYLEGPAIKPVFAARKASS
jgi:glutamate-1-semialdehyde 2,1-aminomutase/spore coat polysaccharide biosynthesis protein SpsF